MGGGCGCDVGVIGDNAVMREDIAISIHWKVGIILLVEYLVDRQAVIEILVHKWTSPDILSPSLAVLSTIQTSSELSNTGRITIRTYSHITLLRFRREMFGMIPDQLPHRNYHLHGSTGFGTDQAESSAE